MDDLELGKSRFKILISGWAFKIKLGLFEFLVAYNGIVCVPHVWHVKFSILGGEGKGSKMTPKNWIKEGKYRIKGGEGGSKMTKKIGHYF